MEILKLDFRYGRLPTDCTWGCLGVFTLQPSMTSYFLGRGGAENLGEDASTADGGDVAVSSFRRCNEDGGTRGDRGVYLQAAENGGSVHIYLTHSVTIPEYEEEDGITDTGKIVG